MSHRRHLPYSVLAALSCPILYNKYFVGFDREARAAFVSLVGSADVPTSLDDLLSRLYPPSDSTINSCTHRCKDILRIAYDSAFDCVPPNQLSIAVHTGINKSYDSLRLRLRLCPFESTNQWLHTQEKRHPTIAYDSACDRIPSSRLA